MEQFLLDQVCEKELNFTKCISRVTQGMINCDIIIMPRENLIEGGEKINIQGALNKYEKEAAYFYKSQGFEIIRLEHFASCGVGDKENIFVESKILGEKLRKHLTNKDYQKYIFKSAACRDSVALNGIYPKDYSLSYYPPDFLVVNNKTKEWKFVEVKSPRDKLHFRQANWYVNLMPENWRFEIFASLDIKCKAVNIKNNLPRRGKSFDGIYSEEVSKANEFNKMIHKK